MSTNNKIIATNITTTTETTKIVLMIMCHLFDCHQGRQEDKNKQDPQPGLVYLVTTMRATKTITINKINYTL